MAVAALRVARPQAVVTYLALEPPKVKEMAGRARNAAAAADEWARLLNEIKVSFSDGKVKARSISSARSVWQL